MCSPNPKEERGHDGIYSFFIVTATTAKRPVTKEVRMTSALPSRSRVMGNHHARF